MWSADNRRRAMKTSPIGGDIKNTNSYLSKKNLIEFDCYNRNLRNLETIYFSQNSLQGEVVGHDIHDYTTGIARLISGLGWKKMDQFTDDSNPALWQFVCNK
jgi:hypothetical protein